MSQEFPVNEFEWIEHLISQFNEDSIKNYNEESDEENLHILLSVKHLKNK